MTKKFTEEEYQKIANFFDKVNKKYYMGLLSSNLVDEVFEKFCRDYDYQLDWQEIVAIMNPITRDWAHEQFVEKAKKYYWKSKKTDKMVFLRRLLNIQLVIRKIVIISTQNLALLPNQKLGNGATTPTCSRKKRWSDEIIFAYTVCL